MTGRLDGRDEAIIDPDLPIIDAHHHLFDKPTSRYLVPDFLEDVQAGHRVVASVYVEGSSYYRADGPTVLRPLGEVEFANGVAAVSASGRQGDSRLCAAIVGYADMRLGDAIGSLLDRAQGAAPERFRGVRQIVMDHPSDAPYRFFFTGRPPAGIYEHPAFPAALRQLDQRGLSYDATGFHLQLPAIARLADSFPNMPFVLNHMTVAMGLDMGADERKELFRDWSHKLAEAARRPNVVCKIGGLGMPVWGFDYGGRAPPLRSEWLAEAWRPFVETAVELFGPDRCMMESNFPPDGRTCGYVPTWNALKLITRSASSTEKLALFHDTAKRVYRMQLPGNGTV